MFDVKDVSFSYGSANAEAFALRDLTLKLDGGVTTAVLGLSGSGKTTLLNLIGLLADGVGHKGEVTYADKIEYDGTNEPELTALRLHEFGFVLQSAYMLRHFTCGHNVGMPLALQRYSSEDIDKRVAEILRLADPTGKLLDLKDRLARDVSSGEQQRMAVLRAVIHDPRVLFADEPLSNLDPRNASLIREVVRKWKAGELHTTERHDRSLVLVTHNIDVAWEDADQFAVLRGGRLVEDRLWPKEELEQEEDGCKGVERLKHLMMPKEDTGSKTTVGQGEQTESTPPDLRPNLKLFLRWFAKQNLWESHALRSTWINIISVALVVAFSILGFALTWGVDESRRQKLGSDPLNLSLWVGSSIVETSIDSFFVADLRRRITDAAGERMLRGVYAFSQTDFMFFDKRGGHPRRCYGRTVAADDPILMSIKLDKSKRDFLRSDENGIIVTRGMLLGLDYGEEDAPDSILVEPPAGGAVVVRVLDVAPEGLPLEHDFLIPEEFEKELRQENQNPEASSIRIGPIPVDWPPVDELPETVIGMIRTFNLFPPGSEEEDGKLYWKLTHNGMGQVPHLRDWRTYVTEINSEMDRLGKSSHPEVANVKIATQDDGPRRLSIRIGPIPDDWPAADELPEAVSRVLSTLGLSARRADPPRGEKPFGPIRWVLTYVGREQRPNFTEWKGLVEEINAEMVRLGKSDHPELANVEVPHDYVGIYLTDIDALIPTAKVCRALQSTFNEDAVEQLAAIGGQTKAILAILTVVALFVGGVVVLNMVLVQVLRNEQKIAEIGMLKAMGMTRRALGRLALVESCLLWRYGTLIGFLVGGVGATLVLFVLICPRMEIAEFGDRFEVIWAVFLSARFALLLAAAALAALVMCWLSNYLATAKSRKASASESLRSA